MPKKVIKKKIVDIIRPIPIKQKIDEDDLKKLGKNLERIDKKVERDRRGLTPHPSGCPKE